MSLPDIYRCGFIKEPLIEELEKLADELHDNWNKRQVFRTEVEMRVSVLNDGKHPDSASKYWQAVREQAAMLDNLALVGFEYRRNEVALKRKLDALASAVDELDREEIQIDIDECHFKRAAMRQQAEDRVREIKLWSKIKGELDDGSFDTTDVNACQLESLYQTLKNRRECLSPGSSQAEVINVLGPLETAERLRREKNKTAQINKAEPAKQVGHVEQAVPVMNIPGMRLKVGY